MTVRRLDYHHIHGAVVATGLRTRGGFHCEVGDAVPGTEPGVDASLIMIGSVGESGFDAFRGSPEYMDGADHPLDRFSQRIIDNLAHTLGGRALYPHQGPPWLAFQRWAARAEPVRPSPLGILIHPRHGLWHAYRGALLFGYRMPGLENRQEGRSPCTVCPDRPCLGACPANAFTETGFDSEACAGFLASPAGHGCLESGCQARLACPVAPERRYAGEQAHFHMVAFARARGLAAVSEEKASP